MGVLDELSDKANSLLDKYGLNNVVKRQTQLYDSSKNTILVAGIPLVGVVSSSINAENILKQEQGVDVNYTIYYETIESNTLTITLLPTSPSNDLLKDLRNVQQKTKGWFSVSVHKNGKLEGVYKAYILSMTQKDMQIDSNDRVYVLALNQYAPNLMRTQEINETTQSATTVEETISQSSIATTVSEVTQQIENIPNTQVAVLEDKPVGGNISIVPVDTMGIVLGNNE
mgnify:FL=1